MAQTRSFTIRIPRQAASGLSRVVNDLPDDEYTELQAAPRRHSPTEEYIFREYICSRRNLGEELVGTTEVEFEADGSIHPVE